MPAAPKAALKDSALMSSLAEEKAEYEALKSTEKLMYTSAEIPPDSPADTGKMISVAPIDPTRQICSLVDLNTVSGSSETLRNSLGGYFYTSMDSYGLLNVPPEFKPFKPSDNIHPNILSVETLTGDVVRTPMSARGFGDQYSDYRAKQIPFTQFVCRIEGNPTSIYLKDIMKGSKYWKTLFMGGTFLDRYYPPIYSTGAYDNNFTVINIPYNNKDKIYLKDSAKPHDFMAATYDYNRHFRKYQQFAASIDNERKLPNIYMLNIVGSAVLDPSPTSGRYDAEYSLSLLESYNTDYYTFEGSMGIEDIYRHMQPDEEAGKLDKTTPPWGDELKLSTKYIEDILPSRYNRISGRILQEQNVRNRNLIFPLESAETLLTEEGPVVQNSVRWPYYNKIEIANDDSDSITFRSMMKNSGTDTIFMKILKESFLGQTGGSVPIRNQQFMKTSKYMTGSTNTMRDNVVTSNHAVAYKTVDLIKMLMYGYENVYNTLKDFQIMDFSDTPTKAALDTRGLYRAVNSKRLATLITDVFSTLGTHDAGTKVSDVVALLNCQYTNTKYVGTSDFIPEADPESLKPTPAYNEIVAYRVEKIGGDPTGDSKTLGVIQNFWIFSDPRNSDIKLLDSQIKYDTDYEYRIYAYYIVKGYKYRYSDLQLSRIIGQIREDGYAGPLEFASGPDGGPPTPPLAYCLEYYDPYTDRSIPDAVDADSDIYNTDPEIMAKISSLSGDAQRIGLSSFRGETGDSVFPPYVAQFNVTLQPSLKIMEVPLMRKTYRVLDNPPNELDVIPGYTLKNDNTITFQMNYETFNPHKYPRPITNNDITIENNYLNANDVSENTLLENESVSYPKEVEIYRLDTKPKSFSDFSTVIPKRVSLKIDGTSANLVGSNAFSYTTAFFSDIIKSNQKHYYLFRVVNDNNIAGNVDTIIEAELVNDGGYKYAIFDNLFDEDLVEEEFVNPSTSFKNIFQLSPNMSQIMVDASEANFNNPLGTFDDKNDNDIADYLEKGSEYTNVKVGVAEDLIWGKTFKIRLTSKKTGKKIDLNITYRDPDIILEK